MRLVNKAPKTKFFHTISDNGHIDKQGVILWSNSSSVTVQLFSWVDGRPTQRQTLDASQLGKWRFYESKGAWLNAGSAVFN